MPRTTHRPTVGQSFTIRWIELILSVLVAVLIAAFLIVAFHIATDPDTAVTIEPGARVCVAMMDADAEPIPDAYYCGPLTMSSHDSIEGD